MKGRVLIVGIDFYNYNLSVSRAFNNLGYETKIFNYWGDDIKSLGEGVLAKLFIKRKVFFHLKQELVNSNLIKQYRTFKPDIVFIIHGWYVLEKTFKKLNKSINALWLMDGIDRYGYHPLINESKFNFFFDKSDVGKFKELTGKSSYFLPLALDEAVYFPKDKNDKSVDISFVGGLFEKRIILLEKIIKRFRGTRIQFYGRSPFTNSNPLQDIIKSNPELFLNRNITPEECNDLYNISKICINIHHDQSNYGVNQRFFEITGSNAFQLTDGNPFIKDNFSSEEIKCYESEEELFQKIEYYLSNEKARFEIAANGYKRVLAEHTFTKRIEEVLSVIKK